MKILVVEDDKIIREGLFEYLSEFSYEVILAKDGKEALEKFNKGDFHLVLLDIGLPFLNGLEVLKEIRKTSKIPVLMLTAFSDEKSKISAFSSLADGYIEKPFSLPLLKVRIDSLLTKNYEHLDVFEYKDASVNFVSYSATYKGKEVDINAKEIEILKFLLKNKRRALTRMQIIDNVWQETDEIPFDRVIDVYIKELRRKLGLDCIVTIRNVGYKLELE